MKAIQKAVKAIVISFCAPVLAACGNNGGILAPKPPDLNKLFTMTASFTAGEESFTADLKRTDVGRWTVTFSEPYQLQGVSLVCSKEGVSAHYEGFTADSLTDDFSSSPASVIIRTLETAVQDADPSVKYGENGFTLQSGGCVLSFEQGTDRPSGFEIAEESIRGEISSFQFNDEVFKNGAEVVIVG